MFARKQVSELKAQHNTEYEGVSYEIFIKDIFYVLFTLFFIKE